MPKIIQVGMDKVTVGFENGSLKDYERGACSGFIPQMGMQVEIYEDGGRAVIVQAGGAPRGPFAQDAAQDAGFSDARFNAASGDRGDHNVSQLAYCVLALLLGGLGIHKFYAGHIGLGILYLLFCWTGIPAVIALVEFILAIIKKPDAHGRIEA